MRDFNIYLAMLKAADTPLERAVVHGWYAPKRSAGNPQTRALRWLAEVEQLERSPELRQALQAAIRRKPKPGDSLQRARRTGLRLPPDIAARFRLERRRPSRRAETLPLPLSFPALSGTEERTGATSVGLDVSPYSTQELRDLAVHWRLSAGRAERAAQQVVSPLYPDEVRVELRRRYGQEAKYAHLLANQAQGLTRTGKTKQARLIDVSSLSGEELPDFQDFLQAQAARAERDGQLVAGPDYPVEGAARDRMLALYRLQAQIYTDLAEQLARTL